MSLVLLAMVTDGSYPTRSRFMGGLTASMYFFAVATPRIDNPLRLAFWTAFHLALLARTDRASVSAAKKQ